MIGNKQVKCKGPEVGDVCHVGAMLRRPEQLEQADLRNRQQERRPEREWRANIKKGHVTYCKEFGVFSAWDGGQWKGVEQRERHGLTYISVDHLG